MKFPVLKLKQIVVMADLPETMPGWSSSTTPRATFTIDTRTWECEGEVSGLVLADGDWWKEQCQKVSDRVRATMPKDLVI